MSADNGKNDFALVPKTPAAIKKAEPGTKRVLSGMVTDALALVKTQRRSKPRIIIVNDWPEPIRLMESLIRDRFEEVELLTFRNGVEAWRELQREPPDLLITDMRRENDPMDGWAMISLLAEEKVRYPVLVVSGYTENAAKHYDEAGKPASITFRELLQQAGQTLDITALATPFEFDEFRKVLEEKVKAPQITVQKPEDVSLIYSEQETLGRCPMCGNRVIETETGYACVASQFCKFRVHKTLLQQPIDREQVQKLLQTGKTDLLERFVSKSGKLFAAHLILNKGKVVFEFPSSPQET